MIMIGSTYSAALCSVVEVHRVGNHADDEGDDRCHEYATHTRNASRRMLKSVAPLVFADLRSEIDLSHHCAPVRLAGRSAQITLAFLRIANARVVMLAPTLLKLELKPMSLDRAYYE